MKRFLAVSLLTLVGLAACESQSVVSPLIQEDQAPSLAKNELPEFELPEEVCPENGCLMGPVTLTRETKAPVLWTGEFESAEDQDVELVVFASSPKTTTVKAWLNEEIVLLPSELPKSKTNEVRVALTLTEGDILEVRLSGKPGTQVAFWVEEFVEEGEGGEEPGGEPETPDPEPTDPQYTFQTTLASYGIYADLNQICAAAFTGSQVADWNDVVAAVEAGTAPGDVLAVGYAFALKDGFGLVSDFLGDSHYAVSAAGGIGTVYGTIGTDLALITRSDDQPVLCVTITP